MRRILINILNFLLIFLLGLLTYSLATFWYGTGRCPLQSQCENIELVYLHMLRPFANHPQLASIIPEIVILALLSVLLILVFRIFGDGDERTNLFERKIARVFNLKIAIVSLVISRIIPNMTLYRPPRCSENLIDESHLRGDIQTTPWG